MQTDITGNNLDISEAMRAHIQKHLRRIAGQLQPPPLRVQVVLTAAKNAFHCDMHLQAGTSISAKADAADMYEAIDRSAEKMARQLREIKGRQKARRHQ